MKKLTNQRGFTLPEILFYLASMIIITMILFGLMKTVTTAQGVNTAKVKFNVEKNQLYQMIERNLRAVKGNIVALDVEEDKTTNPITEENKELKYKYAYLEREVDESTGVESDVEIEVTVMVKKVPEGILYTETNKPEYEDRDIEQTYGSFTDVRFNIIDKVCTEGMNNNLNCTPIDKVFQVELFGEKTFMNKLIVSKSRRAFYYGKE